jgi:hypothetical protein
VTATSAVAPTSRDTKHSAALAVAAHLHDIGLRVLHALFQELDDGPELLWIT